MEEVDRPVVTWGEKMCESRLTDHSYQCPSTDLA